VVGRGVEATKSEGAGGREREREDVLWEDRKEVLVPVLEE